MRKATGAKKASTAVKAAPASHGPPKRASPSSNNSRSRATLAVSASDIGFGATRTPTFIVQSPRSAAKPLCISHAAHCAQARASGSLGQTPSCRSEEHTSELQSLMRISYAVFCLKKKKTKEQHI